MTRTEMFFTMLIGYLQTLPGGAFLASLAAIGLPVLAVLLIIGAALVVRGWISWTIASEEERAKLHDGNAAFVVNQLLVTIAFGLALGSTLVNTPGTSMFWRKIWIALIVQLIGMIALRFLMWGSHRQMMAGNVFAGIRLGVIVLVIGLVTMFRMLQ